MRTKILSFIVVMGTVAALSASQAPPPQGGQGRGGGGRGGGRGALTPLLMETDAFPDGGIVPERFAGRGGNVQPGFKFSNIPEGTVSFAIIFHDLDVALQRNPTDVLHWVVWNIPAAAGGIPEGSLPEGSVQGRGIGRGGYFGPGAPAGPRYHHYVFELYALDSNLDLPTTAGRDELLAAMAGKVLGKAAYVGRFRSGP